MHPFYFGKSERPLFGIYHPASTATSSQGVVLAYPMGHEYIPGYPAMKQLAARLSRAGQHVIRFDYSATGDSAGETGQATVGDWVEDLGFAIQELKDMSGARQLTLIGLRLGASIVTLASRVQATADRFVLWEPIIDGAAYVAELRQLAANYAANTLPRPVEALRQGPPFEVLGFPINADLERSIGELDLTQGAPLAGETLLLTRQTPRTQALLEGLGKHATHQPYEDGTIWQRSAGVNDAVVPARTLDAIVAWTVKR